MRDQRCENAELPHARSHGHPGGRRRRSDEHPRHARETRSARHDAQRGCGQDDEALDAVGELLHVVVRLEQPLALRRRCHRLVAREQPVEKVVEKRPGSADERRGQYLVVRGTTLSLEVHGQALPRLS